MNLTDDTAADYRVERKPLITEIVIPNHATPSLNETNKMSWRRKQTLRKRYEKIIWASTRNQHPGKVRLEIYRHSGYSQLDHDNFIGGCKHLIDALKQQKVIVDDSNEYIREKFYQQVQISRNGPKMTVIKITDLF